MPITFTRTGPQIEEIHNTVDDLPNIVSNENLISNSSFEIAGNVANPPDATPRSYNAGDEIFQGMFAVGALTGVTYIDRKANGTGQLYTDVYKSEKQKLSTASYVPSIAGSNGSPVESGASFVDNVDYWRVTFDMSDTFSVKFEQGSLATMHEVGEVLIVAGSQIQPLNNFWNIYLRPEMVKTGATVAFPPSTGPGATIPAGSQFAYGYFADTELTGVWIDETGGMRWTTGTVRQEVPFDGSDDRLASDIRASFYDQGRVQHYLTGDVTKGVSVWEVRITPSDLLAVGATSMRALIPASADGWVDWIDASVVEWLTGRPDADARVVSVNGGANIAVNQRYEIDIASVLGADWDPDNMDCKAEIFNNSGSGVAEWGDSGWYYNAGSFGVRASIIGSNVVIQTGNQDLTSLSSFSGNGFNTSVDIPSAPCRVKIWKVK